MKKDRFNFSVLKVRKEVASKDYFNDNAMLFFLEKSGKILGIIEANKEILETGKLSRGFYKHINFEDNVDLKKLFKLKFKTGDNKFKVQKMPFVDSIPLHKFYGKVMFIKKGRKFAIIKKVEKNDKIFIVKFKGKKLYQLEKFISDNPKDNEFIISKKYSPEGFVRFKQAEGKVLVDKELFKDKFNISKILKRLGIKLKEEQSSAKNI